MADPIEDKIARESFLTAIAEAVTAYRRDRGGDPDMLMLSPDDVGYLESAYCELYNRSVCMFSGRIKTIVFMGAKLTVGISWGVGRGAVLVGRSG